MSSVAADGCFLSGECSSFYVSIKSTFIELLGVLGFANSPFLTVDQRCHFYPPGYALAKRFGIV